MPRLRNRALFCAQLIPTWKTEDMPRNETILSIFVASPSDVAEERNRVDEVVERINASMARRRRIRFEVLRWERDVSPDFAENGQSVINSQIPQDFDIFVGIVWHTIGTSTERHESGTIEEFELAKKRHDEDTSSVRLMLYFKESPPLSLSEIDPSQLKGVREFKTRIKDKGGFYASFHTPEDFSNKLWMDLTRCIDDWSAEGNGEAEEVQNRRDDGDSEAELDEGFLDLVEEFEEEMSALNVVVENMAEAMSDMGNGVTDQASEIGKIAVNMKEPISTIEKQRLRTQVKKITRIVSETLDQFVGRTKPNLSLYRKHLDGGLNAFLKALPLHIEMGVDITKQKEEVANILQAMDGMLSSIESLHESMRSVPRITTSFAQSRREVLRVLKEIISITNDGKASLEDALSVIPAKAS